MINEPLSRLKHQLAHYSVCDSYEIEKILNVYYLHLKVRKDEDLYVTRYGVAFLQHLKPHNYLTDRNWFNRHSVRLSGTGCSYRVITKKMGGIQKVFVIKWNRMGQVIPHDEEYDKFAGAEFNSPFEEFSLVMEVRNSKYESPGMIITQKPLAIYVPSEKVELWRTGRKDYLMQGKIENHKDVELDMFRSYAVVYEWVKGIDAAEAFTKHYIEESEMQALTLRVEKEMREKGFQVRDRKPHHIIIRPRLSGEIARDDHGKITHAVIDYELLERTPEREESVVKTKRALYLKKQKDRFIFKPSKSFPPQMRNTEVLGVDYIFGHVESTNGRLWVVGKDPELFDYFLPERWESSPRTRLSAYNEIYHTITKDNVHLVWKVSKVGYQPDVDPYREEERNILEFGFNSPFEEISIALELNRNGIRTVYPRAVYMTGKKMNISDSIFDGSRFCNHKKILTPDHHPVLRKDGTYVIIWGYWNGPDERLAVKDGDYLEGINALAAYRKGLLTQEAYIDLIDKKKEKLLKSGIEDLNLSGTHILLSLDSSDALVRDGDGLPEMRICNFELLKRTN